MKPIELIAQLRNDGVKLSAKGDELYCDFPKGYTDQALLREIKTNKSALISLLIKENAHKDEPIEPDFKYIEREAVHSLSFSQKRMLILHSMQTDESVFNISLAFEFKGLLDIPTLDRALGKTAKHHELLRTRFKWIDDEPVQEIEKESALKTVLIDLRRFSEEGDTEILDHIMEQECKKPFDVGKAPLFRVVYIWMAGNRSILLLISHYIAADERSLMILAKEISDHYRGTLEDKTPLDDLEYQYIDYVSWEDAYLKSRSGENELKFWINRFHQVKNKGMLSFVPGENYSRMIKAENFEFELSENLTRAMESFAQNHQATLFMVSYAVFIVIAAGIYSKKRFCCGTPIVNRTRIEIENMIGYFANTLVLTNELDKYHTFPEFLRSVKKEVMEAFANGDIPFEYALQKAGMASNALTRLFFSYTEDGQESIRFKGFSVRPFTPHVNISQNVTSELMLYIRKTSKQLVCTVIYSPKRFGRKFADDFRNDYQKIAESISKHPQATINDLIKACKVTAYDLKKSKALIAVDSDNTSGSPDAFPVLPRNEMEHHLHDIWTALLSQKEISVKDNFFHLGGNSFQAVKIFSAIYQKTGIKLPISTLFHASTIESLTMAIQDEKYSKQWSPIVPIQKKGDNPPLFFVHGAGGNVLLYRALSNRLGTGQPFFGIQAKGLDGHSEVLRNVEDMAAYYVKEIRKIQPEGPYYLGGYCLGGQIAYEMARIIDASGGQVAFVGLLDSQRKWSVDTSYYLKLHHLFQMIDFHWKNFIDADLRGKLYFSREKSIELVRRIHRRFMVLMSMVAYALKIRSDRPLLLMEHINDRAAERYIALPYNGTITLFMPKRNYAGYEDPLMGWGNGLTKKIDVQNLSTYPAAMLVEPFVAELAEKIKGCLERIKQSPPDN